MPGRAWTAEEKLRIVLESMNTNITLAELCREVRDEPDSLLPLEREVHREGGKSDPIRLSATYVQTSSCQKIGVRVN